MRRTKRTWIQVGPHLGRILGQDVAAAGMSGSLFWLIAARGQSDTDESGGARSIFSSKSAAPRISRSQAPDFYMQYRHTWKKLKNPQSNSANRNPPILFALIGVHLR